MRRSWLASGAVGVVFLLAMPAWAEPRPAANPPVSANAIGSLPPTYTLPSPPTGSQLQAETLLANHEVHAQAPGNTAFGSTPPQVGPTYITGPVASYHAARGGPVFEVGALGGGMDSAPFLAHIALDWIF